MTSHVPALVIGGGISGLVCAYSLRKNGINAQLLESSPRPGGVIQSLSRDGYLLELGPQSFTGVPALQDLCRDLGVESQLVQATRSPRFVLVNGTLRPAPLSPPAFFFSSFVSFGTKWAILRDVFGRTIPPSNDESVATFIRRKFSPELLEKLVGPFVSGVYAGDPEKLSLRSAFPQLHEAEHSTGSIVRGMARLGKQLKQSGRPRPALLSFRDGNETLVRDLSAQIGPALRTNARVNAIDRRDSTFNVHLESNGQFESISTNSLILATPTDVTSRLLADLDPSFESLLSPIDYAAVAVVSLGYRKSDIGHSLYGFGFLVPRSSGLRTLGTVWNSSLFPGRAPEGYALLTSFVGGVTDPAATNLNPDDLVSLVHREISPLLSIQRAPSFSHAAVWHRALPQYNLGHADRLSSLEALRARFPSFWLIGNYLRGPSIGSCVEQAQAVAAEVCKTAA